MIDFFQNPDRNDKDSDVEALYSLALAYVYLL